LIALGCVILYFFGDWSFNLSPLAISVNISLWIGFWTVILILLGFIALFFAHIIKKKYLSGPVEPRKI
jgi:hypothetical protein